MSQSMALDGIIGGRSHAYRNGQEQKRLRRIPALHILDITLALF